MPPSPKSRRPSRAPAPAVRIEGAEVVVGSRRVPLRAGAIDYARTDPELWEAAIGAVVDAGLPFLDVCVPWSHHERTPGELDFTSPSCDLGRFLDLAAAAGRLVILRPGPQLAAELTHAGLPERVLRDRRVQARSSRGNTVVAAVPPRMFAAPSYASDAFHEEVGRWYDGLAEVVRPRLAPHGPVAVLALDDAAALLFRAGAYDQDYHPDALGAYRAFLARRYGTVDALRAAYGRDVPSLDAEVPPVRFDGRTAKQLPRHLDWARFQETQVTTAVARLRARLVGAGLDVPVLQGLPLGDAALPLDVPALATTVDALGIDAFHGATDHATLRRRVAWLEGATGTALASRLGVGGPPWYRPMRAHESLFGALGALAYGVRGFSLHVLVERDRWVGAVYDAEGRATARATPWKQLVHALTTVGFERLNRRVEIAVVVPPEYARLARVTQLLGPFGGAALEALGLGITDGCRHDDFGLSGPIQLRAWDAVLFVTSALAEANLPFALVPPGVPAARLASFRHLVVPSYELFDPSGWNALHDASARGAHVVYGPLLPSLDLAAEPAAFDAPRGSELFSFETAEEACTLVASLAADTTPLAARVSGVEHTVHEDDGGARVLFLLNAGETSVTASVDVDGASRLFDPLTEEGFAPSGGIVVPAATVRMLLVERAPARRAPSARPSKPPSARRSTRPPAARKRSS